MHVKKFAAENPAVPEVGVTYAIEEYRPCAGMQGG